MWECANIDFTYYNKKTKDALISLPIAPSASPSATSVRTNLGGVQNSGYEAQINATFIDTRRFGWDVTIAASHNSNKVLSLGVDPAGNPNKTIGTGSTRDSVGFPVNGLYLRPYHYTDANGDGIVQTTELTVDTGVVTAAIIPARPPPFRMESTCSRASSASRRASTTRAASTC